ncbi:MAG: hypothetical protein WAW96_08750 [Alphaproteobacteria bacterium]
MSFAILLSNPALAVSFTGRYDGTRTAAGLAMVLSEDGGELHGRIAAAGKDIYLLNGQVDRNAAKGHLTSPGALADFELEWQPSEVIFTLTPLLADGTPNPGAQKQYAFVRGKANNPALANYHAEPPRRGDSVGITQFLENYRGWSPKEVAIGYSGLSDLDRALINDYDHLQADLMNRLCRGDAPRASLMTVTDHQDVDCDALTSLIDKARATHQIANFNTAADDQRSALYSVVACMHNLYSADQCANIGAEPKRAAENWQSAGRIFADISTYGARSGALVDEVLDKDPDHAPRDAAPKLQPHAVLPSGASALPSAAPVAPPAAGTAPLTVEKPPAPAPKVALAARLRAPVPHRRPSDLAGGHAIESQRVDENMLASVDQSSEILPHARDEGFKTGFGFDLRPSLGDTDEAPITVAGPGATAPRPAGVSATSSPEAAPVPRPRPRRPTSG